MIKVLYLYHDIMNLYGDNGNIRFLEKALKDQGQEVEIARRTVCDKLDDLNEYDVIYCGPGMESNRNVCLKHLSQYKKELLEAFNNDKVFLFTGISYEMFGNDLNGLYDCPDKGIGFFDFNVTEQSEKRYTADVIVTTDLIAEKCVGFINKCSKISEYKSPLFRIVGKVGNTNSECDGIHERNFFGTQLIGPVLIKNPYFARYFIKTILKTKGIEDYKEVEYPNIMKGYETTINELSKDI